MTNAEILTYLVFIICGLSVLLGAVAFIVLMAAEGIAQHAARRQQPRQQAGGPHPAHSGHIHPAASDGPEAISPTHGVLPAGPLTHNFSMVESSIPDGITIRDWRRTRR